MSVSIRVAFFIFILGMPVRVSAQDADSAQVARTEWSRARELMGRNELLAAKQALQRATAAWPGQPAYLWGLANVEAALGDTASLLAALNRYADFGLGRDLSKSGRIASFREATGFGEVAARHNANMLNVANSRVLVTLADTAFWPEDLAYAPATKAFYMTGLRRGELVEVKADGGTRHIIGPHTTGIRSILAVHVDGDALWITSAPMPQYERHQPADSAKAALLKIRIKDGAVIERHEFPAGPHIPGEIAQTRAGDLLITDSEQPVLYRLPKGSQTFEEIRHPLFRSLQGIATPGSSDIVYVADYSHGLLRVDLKTSSVIKLKEPATTTSLGCDGIAWHAQSIICVQNGVASPRIMQFKLSDDGTRIVAGTLIDRNWQIADEPTSGVVVSGRFVYVANSQWEKYGSDGSRKAGAPLVGPILLSAPLQ